MKIIGNIAALLVITVLGYLLFHPELFLFSPAIPVQSGQEPLGEQEQHSSSELTVPSQAQDNGEQKPFDSQKKRSGPEPMARPRYQYSIDSANRTPQSLAVDREHLIVSYRNLNLIDFLDYEGNRLGMFDPAPREKLKIASLYADAQGTLYISDVENRMILVFDGAKHFLNFFPSGQGEQGKRPLFPVGMAGNDRIIVVADMGAATVKTYLPQGEFVMALDKPTSGEQGPWHPVGVAITKDGRTLVSDLSGKRVSVFSCAGEFVYFFSEPETGEGPLKPGAMAIDSLGRVHLVDSGSHRIFVYDNFGRFLFTYGGVDSPDRGMNAPTGIAIDTENNLVYIADSGNRQIDVWSLPK